MLYSFAATFPLLAASKVGDGGLTKILSALLTFLVVLCYFGLHEVARTLEDPFLHPPNDLPAVGLQMEFNSRLLAAWDGCHLPADLYDAEPEAGSPSSLLLERRVRRRSSHRKESSGSPRREGSVVSGLQVGSCASPLHRSRTSPNKFWDRSDRTFPTSRRVNSGDSSSSYGSTSGPLGGSRVMFGSLLNPPATSRQEGGGSGTSVGSFLQGGARSAPLSAGASPVLSHHAAPLASGASAAPPPLL